MGRGILLWLLGVPLPIIILLAIFLALKNTHFCEPGPAGIRSNPEKNSLNRDSANAV